MRDADVAQATSRFGLTRLVNPVESTHAMSTISDVRFDGCPTHMARLEITIDVIGVLARTKLRAWSQVQNQRTPARVVRMVESARRRPLDPADFLAMPDKPDGECPSGLDGRAHACLAA
jgi:hypothetical protein